MKNELLQNLEWVCMPELHDWSRKWYEPQHSLTREFCSVKMWRRKISKYLANSHEKWTFRSQRFLSTFFTFFLSSGIQTLCQESSACLWQRILGEWSRTRFCQDSTLAFYTSASCPEPFFTMECLPLTPNLCSAVILVLDQINIIWHNITLLSMRSISNLLPSEDRNKKATFIYKTGLEISQRKARAKSYEMSEESYDYIA